MFGVDIGRYWYRCNTEW